MMMKNNAPALIDVILTNSKNLLCNVINFNFGLSDCHGMICTCLTVQCNPVKKKKEEIFVHIKISMRGSSTVTCQWFRFMLHMFLMT